MCVMSFAFPHLQYNPKPFSSRQGKGSPNPNPFSSCRGKWSFAQGEGRFTEGKWSFSQGTGSFKKHPFFEIRENSTEIQCFSIGNPRAEAAQPATSLF